MQLSTFIPHVTIICWWISQCSKVTNLWIFCYKGYIERTPVLWHLHIVDLWQYYVCCRRSGVTRCTLFIVLFLSHMCRRGLHAALRSHIDKLMRLLAAEPRSIQGILFSCQYLRVKIKLPLVLWCGTGWFQEQGQCLFIGLAARSLFVSCCFSFLFSHSMGWCYGVGVFGLIWC